MEYDWIKNVAKISDDHTSIKFYDTFNEIINPNSLPKKLTTLGYNFNQKIEPNTLPNNIKSLVFREIFNQKIEPNTLPEKLKVLMFGYRFNQK